MPRRGGRPGAEAPKRCRMAPSVGQARSPRKGVMGSVDATYGFAEGKRTGFDTNGMVVRVYEGDKQGRVVHVGVK